ncbi:MAG: BTAD domain-containing putative transcriptional regulator [Cyanobacteria bacterium P01_A01_bin.123]
MSAKFGRQLNDVELALFKGAWHGKTYEVIATESGYATSYLTRIVGPRFWKHLSQALGAKVSKTSFRAAIEQQGRTPLRPAPHPPLPTAPASAPCPQTDWGEAPDVSVFFGRAQEIATLGQWVANEVPAAPQSQCCRLVAVLGMGGIGKTALTAKFVEALTTQVGCPFTHIIWRSLRNAPPLHELLTEIVSFVSDQQETEATPKRLLHWLRQSRCLLILDNLETLLQGGDRAGYFRMDYDEYGDLLKLVAETRHQSCVVLTSREKPAIVGALEGIALPVRSLQLLGSPEAAQTLLDAKGLMGTAAEKQQLGDRYGHSPLALKIVATSIQSLFDGDITLFLAEDTLVFNGLQRLLDQQFARITALEQTVMIWLAINREWTSITELVDDIQPSVSRMQVLESLESLSWRSLIEKQGGRYTQQPVVMEYVTAQFIQQVVEELNTANLALFLHHALIKTTVKDYIRLSQRRLILKPIANQFAKTFETQAVLEQQVLRILTGLRQSQNSFSGYGAGNLLNLCLDLEMDMAGMNFSNLSLHHAYLQNLTLHQVNFAGAAFVDAAFTQTFGSVLAVTFSSDAQLLAAADTSGQIWLWRVGNLDQPCLTLQGHNNWVWSLAFSPDGQILASGCDDEHGTLKLWDARTGQHLRTLDCPDSRVRAVGWSPDQKLIASSSVDGAIRLWNPETGNCIKTIAAHTNKTSALAWCPYPADGNTDVLATGSADQTLKVWKVSSGECLRVIDVGDAIFAIAWSPDGQQLASGTKDGSIFIWDSLTGECLQTLQGHQKCIWSVSWSADGQALASGGDDQSIRLWDPQTGRCLRILQAHQNAVRAVQWQPARRMQSDTLSEFQTNQPQDDTEVLASGSFDQTVRLWSARADASLKILQGYRNAIQALAWHPTDQRLASGGHDRLVRLWDTRTGKCLMALAGHTQPIWAIAWSNNGQILASSGDDQTIRLWSLITKQVDAVLKGHQGTIWGIAWHPTAAILASASHDQTVRLWDVETGRCLNVLAGHQNFVRTIAWSPNGQLLASGSYDQTLRLWQPETGGCLKVLHDPDNWVWQMAFSPDGKTLATGSTNGDIKLWEIPTGNLLQTLKGHQNSVWALAWRPNGQTLISSSHDQTVRIWRVSDGQCLHTLAGHTNLIWHMALSPDGRTIASGGSDETIRLWDAIAGNCLKVMHPQRPYEGMNITDVRGLTEAQQLNLKALGAVTTSAHQPDNFGPFQPTDSKAAAPSSSEDAALPSHVSSLSVSANPPLVIRLFGNLSLTYNHQAIHSLGSSRTQSLLAYLLTYRHTSQSRQQIAHSLWPDSPDGQGRTNLRKELHNLRRHLPNADDYLQVNTNMLGWQTSSPFWLDVATFEQSLTAAETSSDTTTARQQLEQAVALYTGGLLPSLDDEWILPVRETLHQRFIQALAQLVETLNQAGKYQTALPYAEQLLRLDPLREPTYQQLMQLCNRLGDRAMALQIYQQCMSILREELGIDPSPTTQEMYRALLN